MKRENEDLQMQSENNQNMGGNSQDETNETNNINNQNNMDNSGGPNPAKRQRRSDEEEVRLLIPSKMAGAIIGKGGHNIQKLRTEYKAQVNVGDCQGPERVITVGADLDTCCKVIQEIMKHFDKGNPDECELRILMHQSLAGCVIGKGGQKIKELKDRIGCRLKIFSNIAPQSTDRIAQVIGKEEQCIQTLTEIIDLLKTTPIKGPTHNYDPHNYDDMYADEYGGYGTGNFGRGGGGGGNGGNAGRFGNDRGGRFNNGGNRGGNGGGFNERRSGGNGASGGSGGGMDRRGGGNNNNTNSGSGMRDFVDPWDNGNNGNGQMMGGNGSMNFGNGNNSNGMTSLGNSQNNGNFGNNIDNGDKTSTQVTIPKDLAGAIIGKGGGRIRRIRSESNAFIQIDEALPGSTDRIITITGTPKQIQSAQYMLQQSIRAGSK